MQAKYSRWYFLCLVILCYVTLRAQYPSELTFNVIDNTNGLPNNYIFESEMDGLGFLWIATNDGLCRYDSPTNINVYKKGQLGLNSNTIETIHAKSDSILWIGTHGGLTKLNILDYTSKSYVNDEHSPNGLSNDEILSVQEISANEVWVGTQNGLNVLFPNVDSIYQFPMDSGLDNGIDAKAILDIHQDDKGWIWIGTWGGSMYLYLPSPDGMHSKGVFRKFILDDYVGSEHIWKIYQESSNKYWVATHSGGALGVVLPADANIEPKNQDWVPIIHKFRTDSNNPNSLSSNYTIDIEQDSEGNIWIATLNGINISLKAELESYKWGDSTISQNLKFIQYHHNPNKLNSLTNNHLTDIFIDRHSQLWVGTTHGLNQYNWYSNQFFMHQLEIAEHNSYELINSIYVEDENTAILGSDINGLLTYNLKNQSFKASNTFNIPEFGKRVTTIYKENDEKLYVGTTHGIGIIDLYKNKARLYKFDANNNHEDPNIFIRSIYKDSKGRIWGGTEIGLVQLNEKSGKYMWYTHSHSDSTSISDNSITQTYEDKSGNFWVSTYNGLNLMKKSGNKIYFQRFGRNDPEIGENIPSNQVISIGEYKQKTFFGSRSGIFYFDQNNSSFHILEAQKMNYIISALLITKQGTLWASTSDGILRHNLNNKESKLYGKYDGIGNISFRDAAACKDLNGNIYFGTNQGFVQIDIENLKTNTVIPKVYITDIISINSNSKNNYSGIDNESVILPHDNYYISIDFCALNYYQAENNQYAYRLQGFEDNDWHYTQSQQVVYTNLEAGNYIFQVKASNNEGVWNEIGRQLHIKVKPALIETVWFKLLLGLFIFLALIVAIYIYTKNIRQRNEVLRGYNDRLNLQVKKTEAANTTLEERDKNMKILLKQLDQSNQELIRSNKDLEQFAYVASHDMKEPLRTVGTFTNLLRRRLGENSEHKTSEYMDFIGEGVDRMSSLINSLLTYSQVGKKDIIFKTTDLNDILRAKLKDLSPLIKERNANILFDKLPTINCAGYQIGMVFHNLILNGIKFNKREIPEVKISWIEDNDYWVFSVQDNGIGIPIQYQNQIFEIFKRLHSKEEYEGTGIGLALCNKIVHRHNGEISLKSEVGHGTTFYFTIDKSVSQSSFFDANQNSVTLGNEVKEILRA